MADLAFLAAAAEAAHAGEEHVEAAAFGVSMLTPGFFVALAMLVVFGIMLYARVPALIAAALDGKIAGIRGQLDEAAKLRAEAEALRDQYAAKIASAEKDAAVVLDHAHHEAAAIVAKAGADAAAMVERREKMASDKIGAAERAAIDELRARAADAATGAARQLIAEHHGAGADKSLVDEAIAGI